MELYLLRPIIESGHWEPWYDKTFGFVVRANDEKEARFLASEDAGAEAKYDYESSTYPYNPWLDEKSSTCIVLTKEGKAEMIINDHASA